MVSAMVAAVGAVVAIGRQSAKAQADAAKDQAVSANAAAEAARRQAEAAGTQHLLTDERLKVTKAARDEAPGPLFEVIDQRLHPDQLSVEGPVERVSGASCREIFVVVSNSGIAYLTAEVGSDVRVDHVRWQDAAPGSRQVVVLRLRNMTTPPVNVTLLLWCREKFGSREWNRAGPVMVVGSGPPT